MDAAEDSGIARVELEEAQNAVDHATSVLERVGRSASERDLAAARVALRAAERRLELARRRVSAALQKLDE